MNKFKETDIKMNLLTVLNDYKERGLVYNQIHPTLPLTIWNYTPETQYGEHWDEITLACRGLVTDDKGDIVAKGFSKFFNMEEEKHVATNDFEIFEKLDGSLILVFWYAGQMIVASRGSFTSDYAMEAKRLLDEKYPSFKAFAYPNTTYCFELIGFEQVVVSYPESDLVLTGRFEKDFDDVWNEINMYSSESLYLSKVKLVKRFDGLDWANVKQLNWANSEGFVVRFSNGQRMKIKFEDYIKLHRSMTNLSTRGIWEALVAGEPVSSILGDVPDEFYGKVHEYETMLKNQYEKLESINSVLFIGLSSKGYSRKEFAARVYELTHPELPANASVLFCMLDGKDYSKHIWKMIEPEFQKL